MIDKDAKRVAALNDGAIPIFEPGLDDIVHTNVRSGRLEFSVETKRVADADAVFIAVGTPSRRGDGHADLSFVYDAVRQIAPILSATVTVVTKSTVPVGTGDEIEHMRREQRPDAAIEVVSNPEFLREGADIQDFKHRDRIVVGTDNARARAVPAEVYRPLYLNAAPILSYWRATARPHYGSFLRTVGKRFSAAAHAEAAPPIPWFASIQGIQSKQDLPGLPPKGCFISAQAVKREVRQIGE